MRCQLVLQFRGDALEDFEQVIALETELCAQLGDSIVIDRHEMSSDESNIFIWTNDPVGAFVQISDVLERQQLLDAVVAAYRPDDGKVYTVIWPSNSTREFAIA
jgi:hypothetical protein